MQRHEYMTRFSPLLAALAIALTAAGLAAETTGQRIEVMLTNIKADQGGTLIVGLYRGKDGWLEIENAYQSQRIEVDGDTQPVIFEVVEPGDSYAVAVIHDKNENGKMDLRKFPFPKPKEGVGVSNNNIGLGPPSYRKAEFAVSDEPVALNVELNY